MYVRTDVRMLNVVPLGTYIRGNRHTRLMCQIRVLIRSERVSVPVVELTLTLFP